MKHARLALVTWAVSLIGTAAHAGSGTVSSTALPTAGRAIAAGPVSITIGEHEFECGAAREVLVTVTNTSTAAVPRSGKVVVTTGARSAEAAYSVGAGASQSVKVRAASGMGCTGALQPLEVKVTDPQGAALVTKSLKPKSFALSALAAQIYTQGSSPQTASDHGIRRVSYTGDCATSGGGLGADILGGTQAQAFSLTLKANGVEGTATGNAAAAVSTPAQFTAQVPVNCAQGPGAFSYKLTTGRTAEGTVTTGTVRYTLAP